MQRLRRWRRGVSRSRTVDNGHKRSFFLGDPDGMLTEYYVSRQGEPAIGSAENAAYLV